MNTSSGKPDDDSLGAAFSNDVRLLRESMGATQAEFAQYIGVEQATVSRWESRKSSPSLGNIRSLILLAEKTAFGAENLAVGSLFKKSHSSETEAFKSVVDDFVPIIGEIDRDFRLTITEEDNLIYFPRGGINTKAVRIKMWLSNNRSGSSIMFFEDFKSKIGKDQQGRVCLTKLHEDESIYFCKILQGSKKNSYHLLMADGGMMSDRRIEWAEVITNIIP